MEWFHKAKISGVTIAVGTAVTRAGVRADGGDDYALGSIYLSTDRAYLKVAHTEADTDWNKITTSAAD